MKKINVAQIVNQLSLGGTEKTLEIFSKYLDKNLFNVSIFAAQTGGDRYEQLKDSFPTFILNENKAQFVNLLKERKINILHVHRSGSEEPFALDAARGANVPIIVETKVFGQTDKSHSAKAIDLSIFVSKMCALRYIKKNRLSVEDFFKRNRVLYNPLDLEGLKSLLCSKEELSDFKNKIGISDNTPLIGRLSRQNPFKFGDICLKMLPFLAQEIPNFKYLIVGLPEEKRQLIKKLGVGKYIIERPFTNDKKELAKIYQSLDVLAYASQHGESFGYVIAEAMAFGKPVVVNSTPEMDNAQVELVDHARTGFIANSPRSYARAIAYLLKNKTARQKMGRAGRQKASRCFDARQLTKQLERIYLDLCFEKKVIPFRLPQQEQPFDLAASQLSTFARDYRLRKKIDFGRSYNQSSLKSFFSSLLGQTHSQIIKLCPVCNLPGVDFFTDKQRMTAKPRLSVLLIILNEEQLVQNWLQHVSRLSPAEIVIVDGGSTDRTKDIIKTAQKELPIKLIEHPMGDSFSEQRNLAKQECQSDWILALDADETLTEESFSLLPKLLASRRALAYSFPRVALFPDPEHFFGPPNGDLQLRLFRNLPAIEYIHKIHERPAYQGREIHPGLIRTKQGWKWCRIKRELKILHAGYLKPQKQLIERGRRWQKFKEASKERGIEVGGEDFFVLDEKKLKIRPIEELIK